MPTGSPEKHGISRGWGTFIAFAAVMVAVGISLIVGMTIEMVMNGAREAATSEENRVSQSKHDHALMIIAAQNSEILEKNTHILELNQELTKMREAAEAEPEPELELVRGEVFEPEPEPEPEPTPITGFAPDCESTIWIDDAWHDKAYRITHVDLRYQWSGKTGPAKRKPCMMKGGYRFPYGTLTYHGKGKPPERTKRLSPGKYNIPLGELVLHGKQ